MSVPFRDEDAGALARITHLEDENERLARELETLCDSVGENEDAYVRNIENQVAALSKENGDLSAAALDAAAKQSNDLPDRAARARHKAQTFRVHDDKAGALARAERLEVRNEELRKEIDALKDGSGAARSYVERLEKRLAELKKTNAALREKQAWKPQKRPLMGEEEERRQLWQAAVIAVLVCLYFALRFALSK